MLKSKGFYGHIDKCFKLQEDLKTWSEAEQACGQFGGNLASISDRFEQYWMNNNINVKTDTWIGLAISDSLIVDDSYKWSSKDKVEFTHWDRSYPNATEGKCVVMRPNGFWANMPCEVKRIRLVVSISIFFFLIFRLIFFFIQTWYNQHMHDLQSYLHNHSAANYYRASEMFEWLD